MTIALDFGLSYVQTIYDIMKASSLAGYAITGVKVLAVGFFLVNIIQKYIAGVGDKDGYTWGLKPADLLTNFSYILIVIFSTQILGYFDAILVAIDQQFIDTAPSLLPLQLQNLEIESEGNALTITLKAMQALYDFLTMPLKTFQLIAFIFGLVFWAIDLFIYPLFLAERFFLLGIMQLFFPLVMAMSMLKQFRDLAIRFFKLYIGVYMLVPAFFVVNIFVNGIYTGLGNDYLNGMFGVTVNNKFFEILIQPSIIAFIVVLKFKLYKRATSFVFQIFT